MWNLQISAKAAGSQVKYFIFLDLWRNYQAHAIVTMEIQILFWSQSSVRITMSLGEKWILIKRRAINKIRRLPFGRVHCGGGTTTSHEKSRTKLIALLPPTISSIHFAATTKCTVLWTAPIHSSLSSLCRFHQVLEHIIPLIQSMRSLTTTNVAEL